jgi:hypothetical protein
MVSSSGVGLHVAERPGAAIHGVDTDATGTVRERKFGEQITQRVLVSRPRPQHGVQASPATAVDRCEAVR